MTIVNTSKQFLKLQYNTDIKPLDKDNENTKEIAQVSNNTPQKLKEKEILDNYKLGKITVEETLTLLKDTQAIEQLELNVEINSNNGNNFELSPNPTKLALDVTPAPVLKTTDSTQTQEKQNINVKIDTSKNSTVNDVAPDNGVNGVIEGNFDTGYGIYERGNGYFINSVLALNSTENGKQILKEAITSNPDGSVTINFKGIGKSCTITAEEIKENDKDSAKKHQYSTGDNDMLVLELAAEKLDLNSFNITKALTGYESQKKQGSTKDLLKEAYESQNFAIQFWADQNFNLVDGTLGEYNMYETNDFYVSSITADTITVTTSLHRSTEESFTMSWDEFAKKAGDIRYTRIENAANQPEEVPATPDIEVPFDNGVNGVIDEDVSRSENFNDSWVLNGILALNASETGKQIIKDSIQNNPDGSVTVTFKGMGVSYTISADEIKKHDTDNNLKDAYSNGDNDMLVLELATEKLKTDIINKKVKDVNESGYYSYNLSPTIENGGKSEVMLYYLTGQQAITYGVFGSTDLANEIVPAESVINALNKHVYGQGDTAITFRFYPKVNVQGNAQERSSQLLDIEYNENELFYVTNVTSDTITYSSVLETDKSYTLSWEEFANLGLGTLNITKLKSQEPHETKPDTTPDTKQDIEVPFDNGVNGVIDEVTTKGSKMSNGYMLTDIIALSKTEVGAELLKDSIKSNDDGSVTVSFKGVNASYTITADEIKKFDTDNIKNDNYSNGDNDVLVLELAMEKLSQDIQKGKVEPENHTSELKDMANQMINGGGSITPTSGNTQVMRLLTGVDTKVDNRSLDTILDEHQGKDNTNTALSVDILIKPGQTALGITRSSSEKTNGAYSLAITNITNDSVTIINPYTDGKEVTVSRNELAKYFYRFEATDLSGLADKSEVDKQDPESKPNIDVEYNFPELIDMNQDAKDMEAAASKMGLKPSACKNVYTKNLKGFVVHYIWNSNDKEFEIAATIKEIRADGSYTTRNGQNVKTAYNALVAAIILGYTPTTTEGLYSKNGNYYYFDEVTKNFVEIEKEAFKK